MGKTLFTKTYHKTITNPLLVIHDIYNYSPQDRLVSHLQQINDQDFQLIAKNDYDELGQLITKNVGGFDVSNFIGLQKVDYSYNIRGWLKSINNPSQLEQTGEPTDLFGFKINYNTVENSVDDEVKPLYNGNISETFWSTYTDNTLRKYGYKYDDLNRLKRAIYQKPNNSVAVTNMYDETLDYDKNGNITKLQRNGDFDADDSSGTLAIDNLDYFYHQDNKNVLLKVTDATNATQGFNDDSDGTDDTTDDYSYDANGNMTKDENKNITSIRYNHLNLPVRIDFVNNRKIEYLYNAVGQKLQKKVFYNEPTVTTDYVDGFQYTNGILKFFPHAKGYANAVFSEDKYKFYYVFSYLDHLGNIRLNYSEDPSSGVLKIMEENHYYPFGLKHSNYNAGAKGFVKELELYRLTPVDLVNVPYKYKFQGQERQDELGLNWDSFKYRNYDYAIGRFMSIDPLAEKYAYQSPYNFSENRVIDAREFEGLEKVSVHLLDNLSYNGSSSNIVGNVSMDMGNKNSVAFRLSVQGIGNINGTYSQKEGFEYNVSKYIPDMKDAWASTMAKGIKIPDFLAKWGINNAKDDINPETVEEALAMAQEQVEMNETMNYILTTAYGLIDNDTMDAYYSFDGTISGKFEGFRFSHGKFVFIGDAILEYKEPYPKQEKKEEKKKEEKKEEKK